jgi:flagellar hook-basal body complex protein FliE
MSKKPTPAEIRAAQSYLRKKRKTPPVSPRKFAAAAKEQGKSFSELLQFIMRIFQGQQNQASQQRERVLAASRSGK